MAEANTRLGPTDDEIVEGVEEAGGVEPYAKILGVAPSTLRREIVARGIQARVDAARARAAAGRRAIANGDPVEDAEVPEGEEAPPQPTREEILDQELREARSELRRLREGQTFDHRVVQAISDAASSIEPRYDPNVIPARSEDRGQHEFVLLFSDTHAGEVVNPEETLGMNEYDWDVMLRRMAKIQRSVFSYQENRPYSVSKLHVWMLGDMLSGDIHDELTETNDRPMAEATVQFGADAAQWLTEFEGHFDEVEVKGVPGNHPRRTRKPAAKMAHNNGDWIAYKFAEQALADNPKFTFDFPRAAYATATVAERWRCLLMHGDGIRTTMPGVPWGGVVRRITTLQQQFAHARQPIDYVALGHFHTANALDGVGTKTFLNGSVKGVDEYSLKQFGSGRGPSQLLLTFHPKWGITDVSYIDLEPVRPAGDN